MEEMPVTTIVGTAGFVIGIGMGAIVQRTNFCAMGAVADAMSFGDYRRARAWMLAIATAVLGTQAMHLAGIIDIHESIYLGQSLGWLGGIIGGLLFGFGMMLGGGCGSKNLVRIGGGDLKSLIVVIVLGIFAYMTLRGLTGLVRVGIEGAINLDIAATGLEASGMTDLIAVLTGIGGSVVRSVLSLIVAGGLIWFCFNDESFRATPQHIVSGIGIGLLVTAGWWATGVLGADDFDPAPLASLTFVAPAGNSLQYLMTFTGSTITFGIASVGGVILGAFIAAKASGQFHLAAFNGVQDMAHHLIGGAMMGLAG